MLCLQVEQAGTIVSIRANVLNPFSIAFNGI